MTPVQHFVVVDGDKKGPYTLGQIRRMWESGTLTSETLHFMDGYSEWMPLGYIADDLEETTSANPPSQHAMAYQAARPVTVAKNRGIYIILGLFLGGLFGVHNFYAGRFVEGVIQLLITLTIGWLILPLVAVALWVLIELCVVKKDGKGITMA